MDALTFITKLLEHLVWPALVVVVVLLLRKQIVELIPLLKKLEYGKFKAEFAQEVGELKEESLEQNQAKPEEPEDPALDLERDQLMGLAAASPSSAVLAAWNKVEKAAWKLVRLYQPNTPYNTSTPYKMMQDTLESGGLLEPDKIKVFSRLRNLRNKVSHAPNFALDQTQVIDYIDIALDLKSHLKQKIRQGHESLGGQPPVEG